MVIADELGMVMVIAVGMVNGDRLRRFVGLLRGFTAKAFGKAMLGPCWSFLGLKMWHGEGRPGKGRRKRAKEGEEGKERRGRGKGGGWYEKTRQVAVPTSSSS